jgi:hypothetical protein
MGQIEMRFNGPILLPVLLILMSLPVSSLVNIQSLKSFGGDEKIVLISPPFFKIKKK